MAKNKFDVGNIVATSMQQIIQSDEHKKIFFKRSDSKCCSCSSCEKDCSCKNKCGKECVACTKDTNHVHDTNCDHNKVSAVNEIIDLLSKISTIQDELGLTKTSLITMQALASMVKELQKTAQEDSNDISYDELIQSIKKDPEQRLSGKLDYNDYPDIAELLRQRIQESETGEVSFPIDIFDEGVSADPASEIPDSYILSPPLEEDLSTWSPDAEQSQTELPPASLRSERFPLSPRLPDIDRTIIDDETIESNEDREKETVRVTKNAFEKLNNYLRKEAEESDFEEESDIFDSEMSEDDLEQLLFSEESLNDESFTDDTLLTLNSDQELESENFLESSDDLDEFIHDYDHEREDADPGFTYPGLGENDDDMVRLPGNEWVPFKDLDEADKDELEFGAGMRERLDLDPDKITDEEAYADEFDDVSRESSDAEGRLIGQLGSIYNDLYGDPEDDEYAPEKVKYWND